MAKMNETNGAGQHLRAEGCRQASAWIFSLPPFGSVRSSYSKRVPVAVEQPLLYTSPFNR